MEDYVDLLNGNVLNKSNEKVDLNDEKYKNKVIGFYFSAHWCPPCRRFTPILIEFYNKHAAEKKFEIIFISSDSDEESFEDYYKDMPWLKLDFQQSDIKDKLEAKFKVEGIPRLIFIDGQNGEFICNDARDYIQTKDKSGEKFPWKSDGKKEDEAKDCILL